MNFKLYYNDNFIVISARRRRLSFGRDEFLSSAAKKLSNTASEDLKSSDDFHDLHQHLVWMQLKFRYISANYMYVLIFLIDTVFT